MAIKLIVIVSFVAVIVSNVGTPVCGDMLECSQPSPAAPQVYIFPTTAASSAAPKPEDTAEQISDPAVTTAYDTHKAVLKNQYLKTPYHYIYGYESHNWKTNLTQSHYESRYGDVGVGIFIRRDPNGIRSVVDYTVDTPNGFYAVLRKDSDVRPTHFGYARLSGPLAYASHPPLEEYISHTTLITDTANIDEPMAKSANRTQALIFEFFDLVAPFNVTWGYEVTDTQLGVRRSQYETYYGEIGEGSFTQIGADGVQSIIDYSASPKGFAVTSPRTVAIDDNPLVHPGN